MNLSGEQLSQVAPKLRRLVIEAWQKGESVPSGVLLVGDRDLTAKERQIGISLEPLAREVLKRKKL